MNPTNAQKGACRVAGHLSAPFQPPVEWLKWRYRIHGWLTSAQGQRTLKGRMAKPSSLLAFKAFPMS
ncbi:MAG TPA: hypothetical protein V6C78_17480 [Crinalium sp.]